ncbi:MAG: nicotinate (nicotinamide) nucleotide adenylyltransferase [Phocaeicola sp.]
MENQQKIKTALFGGSFNPIHIGHLALANYLCEWGEVDEFWFLVSPQNPLKVDKSDLWEDQFRLELVKAAIANYPKFKLCDIEFQLPRPSYTIHTLRALSQQYPDREFTLIIGADNWQLFPRWYEAEEILANYSILIYPRPGFEVDESKLPQQVRLVQTPLIEVSSTFIRESLAAGKDVRYFLHPAVYEKILSTTTQ